MSEGEKERDPGGAKQRRTNGWLIVAATYGSILLAFIPSIRSPRVALPFVIVAFGLGIWALLTQLPKQGFKKWKARLLAAGFAALACTVWWVSQEPPKSKPQIALSLVLSPNLTMPLTNDFLFIEEFGIPKPDRGAMLLVPVGTQHYDFRFAIGISNVSPVHAERVKILLQLPRSVDLRLGPEWQNVESGSFAASRLPNGSFATNSFQSWSLLIDSLQAADCVTFPLWFGNLPPKGRSRGPLGLIAKAPEISPFGVKFHVSFIRTNAPDIPAAFAKLNRPLLFVARTNENGPYITEDDLVAILEGKRLAQ